MFITLEGGEGVGKTTQATRLADRLRAQGFTVHVTREPGGTPLGSAIRATLLHPNETLKALHEGGLATTVGPAEEMLPVTEALLLSADRAQHVGRVRQWLNEGAAVISDRYADATRAYQGAARGVDEKTIEDLIQIATGGLTPDLTILLDMPVKEALRRKQASLKKKTHLQLSLFEPPAWNRMDKESIGFHERVRAGYLALAAAEPERWVVLDAAQSPEALAQEVWQAVRSRVAPRTLT